jgi:hypothetical protein
MWSMISYLKGRTQIKGVLEESAEEIKYISI